MGTDVALIDAQGNMLVDLDNLDYDSIAALTGQSNDVKSHSGLPIVGANVKPEMKIDDKTVEVPYKTWRFRHPEFGFVFMKDPSLRIFMSRFMYSRYDEVEKTTSNYSTMIENWKTEEAQDIRGTTNCGKFQGFVNEKQWASLTEKEKKYQTGAKRVRVVLGTLSGKAVKIDGSEVDINNIAVRFNFGGDSFKNIGNVMAEFDTKRIPALFRNVKLGMSVQTVGATTFGVAEPVVDWSTNVVPTKADMELLQMFSLFVKQHNKEVLEKYHAVLKEAPGEDSGVDATDFVDVD